jgi:sphingolipid 8-(E)-desaturase
MPSVEREIRKLSPRQVEDLIAHGHAVVIYHQDVLKLDAWIKYHPGGDKAIHHMIGRDATDEMNCYHSDETRLLFARYRIGQLEAPWRSMLPPIQGGKYRKLEDSTTSVSKKKTSDDMKLCGEMEVEIVPKIPQDVILLEGMDEYYPVINTTEEPIRDPRTLIDNYDNVLVKEDLQNIPSLDYDTQRWLSKKYAELHQKVIDENLYQCRYIEYYYQFLINLGLGLYCLIFYKTAHYFLSAVFLGFFWQQLVFVVHDAGHLGVTHNFYIDNIISILIADWIGGLSVGWWKRNHNVHHIITNDPVHDPDIQHLPFFCVSSRLFGNIFSTYYEKFLWFDAFAKKLIPIQHYLYYPILCFGRFNLYRLSWEYVLKGQGPRHGKAAWFRYFELAGLVFFNWWFFYIMVGYLPTRWDKFQFVMVSHIATMIVHVQITLSHFAMSTSDLGVSESFVSRQMRTTMDVDCPDWFDFFHGGLQYQAIHHLFPRIPRHNFRRAQKYIIQFCKETGLKYSIYGFVTGNGVVINKLYDIGRQVVLMRECMAVESGAIQTKTISQASSH